MADTLSPPRRRRSSSILQRGKLTIKLPTKMEESVMDAARALMDFKQPFQKDDFAYNEFFKQIIKEMINRLDNHLRMFAKCTCQKTIIMDHLFLLRSDVAKGNVEYRPSDYLVEVRSMWIDQTQDVGDWDKKSFDIVKFVGNICGHILSEHSDIDVRVMEQLVAYGLKILAFRKTMTSKYSVSVSTVSLACAIAKYNEMRVLMKMEPISNTMLTSILLNPASSPATSLGPPTPDGKRRLSNISEDAEPDASADAQMSKAMEILGMGNRRRPARVTASSSVGDVAAMDGGDAREPDQPESAKLPSKGKKDPRSPPNIVRYASRVGPIMMSPFSVSEADVEEYTKLSKKERRKMKSKTWNGVNQDEPTPKKKVREIPSVISIS